MGTDTPDPEEVLTQVQRLIGSYQSEFVRTKRDDWWNISDTAIAGILKALGMSPDERMDWWDRLMRSMDMSDLQEELNKVAASLGYRFQLRAEPDRNWDEILTYFRVMPTDKIKDGGAELGGILDL